MSSMNSLVRCVEIISRVICSFLGFVILFPIFDVQTTIRLNNPFCLPILAYSLSISWLGSATTRCALTFAICDDSIFIYLLTRLLSDSHLFKYLNCNSPWPMRICLPIASIQMQHSSHFVCSLHSADTIFFPIIFQ